MTAPITITFPDGRTRRSSPAPPPPRSRRRSGRAWPRPRSRPRSTATGTTSTGRSTTTRAVAIVTPDSDDGREVLRHSTAHVMAQAVTDLFPGAKYAIGPAIADGFYYDFALPGGAHFSDDDLARIEARMREIVAADEPFVREEVDRAAGEQVFADQPYKLEIIEKVDDSSEVGEGTVISVYRNPARRIGDDVRRPLPRPARAVDQAARRVQAQQGRRRVLARRREAPDAPAHLRHRVGVEGRARGAPAPPRGGRAARPPQARVGARPLLVPRGDRLGPRGVPPQGRARPQGDGGLLAAAPRGGRLRVRQLAAHHQGEPVRDLGPPRLVRRRHVPADGARTAARRRTTSSR